MGIIGVALGVDVQIQGGGHWLILGGENSPDPRAVMGLGRGQWQGISPVPETDQLVSRMLCVARRQHRGSLRLKVLSSIEIIVQ